MVMAGGLERGAVGTRARGSGLDELLTALSKLDLSSPSTTAVETLLRAATIDEETLERFVAFAPGRYTRNAAYRDDRFEVLILCWAPGSTSPIHDHGKSRCFVKLLRGSLNVENYTLAQAGRAPGTAVLTRSLSQLMNVGDIDVRSSTQDIHRVAPIGGPAVSLHVYARPLDRCLVFDVEEHAYRWVQTRYDRPPPH